MMDEVVELRELAEKCRSGGYTTDVRVDPTKLIAILDEISRLREGDQPVAWRDLHPKISNHQFLRAEGVTIDEDGFVHFDRVGMTAIWHMLLDLQTAAHDTARPSSPPPGCPTYGDLLAELAACRDLATLASGHDDSEAIADPLCVADHVSHALSIPPEHRRSPPPGWKLVPVEPAPEQLIAGINKWWCGIDCVSSLPAIYRAMLAAAPEAMP